MIVFALSAGTAFADETYKFSNGVTFSYPSGFQLQETKQPPATITTIFNISDPTMSFVVSVVEGTDESAVTAIKGDLDEDGFKSSLPQGVELITLKKLTLDGHEGILSETATQQQGTYIFSRALVVVSGQDMISVGAAYMGEEKVDAGRKISEGIEKSLKF
jgi:hypothetical protein